MQPIQTSLNVRYRKYYFYLSWCMYMLILKTKIYRITYYDRNTYLENMRWNTYLKENLV